MNSKKIILDLCGGTGAWSKPYKLYMYDVRVITHPMHDIFEYTEYEHLNIYGILAAPPCTMFSFARTTARTPRDLSDGFKTVQRCLEIIWHCRLNGNLKFWALENPVGYLRQFLGKPPLTFNPHDYGDNYSKKTDLWGYYNVPKVDPKQLTRIEQYKMYTNSRKLPELPSNYILPDDVKQSAARRSMTSKFFAEAFFNANR